MEGGGVRERLNQEKWKVEELERGLVSVQSIEINER